MEPTNLTLLYSPLYDGVFAILSLSVVNFSILDPDPQIIDTDGHTSHRQRVT
jgi:hypothetical protein